MKYLVVANGEPPSAELLNKLYGEHDSLVAVDGGLHTCMQYKLAPDLITGDFDSLSQQLRESFSQTSQLLMPDQNKSDLEKTLSYLFEQEATEITVCGALGKRVDHTLTNICLLCRYPGKVKFETDREICFALPKSSVLSCHKQEILSLIPFGTVEGVTTQGLQWELDHATLDKSFLSISNVSVQTRVSISFKTGDLILCRVKESE